MPTGKSPSIEVMEQSLTVLTNAAQLVDNIDHWCKSGLATKSNGAFTRPTAQSATRFCVMGAIFREFSNNNIPQKSPIRTFTINALFEVLPPEYKSTVFSKRIQIENFNDNSVHEDIKPLFDAAIKTVTSRLREARACRTIQQLLESTPEIRAEVENEFRHSEIHPEMLEAVEAALSTPRAT